MKIEWRILGVHLAPCAAAWVLGPSNLMVDYAAVSSAGCVAFTALTLPGGTILSYFITLLPDAPFWIATAIDAAAIGVTQLVLLGLVLLVLAIRQRLLPNSTVETDARNSGAGGSR
jgi:hypothetical protein